MRTDKTASGDRTLLPGTKHSKSEVKKTFRASKQLAHSPAPALLPLPRNARANPAPPPPCIPPGLPLVEPLLLYLSSYIENARENPFDCAASELGVLADLLNGSAALAPYREALAKIAAGVEVLDQLRAWRDRVNRS